MRINQHSTSRQHRERCLLRASAGSSVLAANQLPVYRPIEIAQQTLEIRERLCKESLSGGLIYLESGEQILRNGSDVFFPFRAESNFLYATGVNQPNFGCLLDTDSGMGEPPEFILICPCLHVCISSDFMPIQILIAEFYRKIYLACPEATSGGFILDGWPPLP